MAWIVPTALSVLLIYASYALELFKKTLPSGTALIQLATTTRPQRRRDLSSLRSLMVCDFKHKVNLHMMLVALNRGGECDKVARMIDNMIAGLENKQTTT